MDKYMVFLWALLKATGLSIAVLIALCILVLMLRVFVVCLTAGKGKKDER